MRQRWAQNAAAHASPAVSPLQQVSDEELEDGPFDDEDMGVEDEDLTMGGELEIDIPPVKWPALHLLSAQKTEQPA